MSRVEKFDPGVGLAAEDEDGTDENFMRLWLTAGAWAQTFTILGFLATLCGILFYHL